RVSGLEENRRVRDGHPSHDAPRAPPGLLDRPNLTSLSLTASTDKEKKTMPLRSIILALLVCAPVVPAANAATIIDEWASIKAPPPPAVKPVTVDKATTALLMLDFNEQTCNMQRRPRCVASI